MPSSMNVITQVMLGAGTNLYKLSVKSRRAHIQIFTFNINLEWKKWNVARFSKQL